MGYEAAMSNLSTFRWHAYNTEFRVPEARSKPVFSDDGAKHAVGVFGYRQ